MLTKLLSTKSSLPRDVLKKKKKNKLISLILLCVNSGGTPCTWNPGFVRDFILCYYCCKYCVGHLPQRFDGSDEIRTRKYALTAKRVSLGPERKHRRWIFARRRWLVVPPPPYRMTCPRVTTTARRMRLRCSYNFSGPPKTCIIITAARRRKTVNQEPIRGQFDGGWVEGWFYISWIV